MYYIYTSIWNQVQDISALTVLGLYCTCPESSPYFQGWEAQTVSPSTYPMFHKHKDAQLMSSVPKTSFHKIPNEQDSTQNISSQAPVFDRDD